MSAQITFIFSNVPSRKNYRDFYKYFLSVHFINRNSANLGKLYL